MCRFHQSQQQLLACLSWTRYNEYIEVSIDWISQYYGFSFKWQYISSKFVYTKCNPSFDRENIKCDFRVFWFRAGESVALSNNVPFYSVFNSMPFCGEMTIKIPCLRKWNNILNSPGLKNLSFISSEMTNQQRCQIWFFSCFLLLQFLLSFSEKHQLFGDSLSHKRIKICIIKGQFQNICQFSFFTWKILFFEDWENSHQYWEWDLIVKVSSIPKTKD